MKTEKFQLVKDLIKQPVAGQVIPTLKKIIK